MATCRRYICNEQTKTYSQLRVVNLYYDEYLIHLAYKQHLIVTLIMLRNTPIELAREISADILNAHDRLNAKV